MHNFVSVKKYTTGLLILTTLFALGYAGYMYQVQTHYQEDIDSALAELRPELLEMAVTVRRSGSDPTLATYVYTCTQADNRRFEQLLSRLAVLDTADTEEVQALFPTCGTVSSRTRHALLQRLQDAYTGYGQMLQLQVRLGDESAVNELALWNKLLTLETERATTYAQFVSLQGELIANHLDGDDGVTANQAVLDEAAELQATLDTASAEVTQVLEQLQSYDVSS